VTVVGWVEIGDTSDAWAASVTRSLGVGLVERYVNVRECGALDVTGGFGDFFGDMDAMWLCSWFIYATKKLSIYSLVCNLGIFIPAAPNAIAGLKGMISVDGFA
jgi:hypothetical protein